MVLKRNDRWVRIVVAVLTLVGAIAAFALFGRPVAAGTNIWTPMGPQSFAGIAARDSAGTLYATSLYPAPRPDTNQPVSTVYRSSDGGQTWAAVGNYATAEGANYRSGVSMFSASANGSVLMVGVLTDIGMSLLKSTDSGTTWRVATSKVQFLDTYGHPKMTIHPADANRMYVGGTDGLYRSTDGGASWQRALDHRGWTVAVDPTNPARLLAIGGGGVRVSDDYGGTWRAPENRGGVNPALEPSGNTVMFVGGQGLVLAAGSGSQRSGGVVYISKDGGITWARISALSGGRVLGADASQGRMYVLTRTYRPESQQDVSPIQVVDTLYTSTDGDTWTVASRAPLRRNVEDLTYSYIFGSFQGVEALHVSQTDPMRMFRNDGTYSRNGGQSWEPPSGSLPLNRHAVTSFDVITGVDTAPARGLQSPLDQHFAARLEQPRAITKGWLVGSGQMLFRSTDSGGKWDLLYEGVDWFYSSISAVGMSGDGNIVLLHLSPARVSGGPGGHYEREPAVMRSTDRGATWNSRPVLNTKGGPTRFTFVGEEGRTVYIASSPSYFYGGGSETSRDKPGGLYKSTDSGATWSTLNVGMVVNNVLVDERDANHLWAAGDDGLAESRNGGATWTLVRTSPQVGGLIHTGGGSNPALYAYGASGYNPGPPGRGGGVLRGPLYRSTDEGRTWNALRIEGAPADYRVHSFTVEGRELVVAWSGQASDSLVQISDGWDGGRYWRTLNGFGLGDRYGSGRIEVDPVTGVILTIGPSLMGYRVVEETADPAFRGVWQRQDEPVQKGVAQRSWTWGPRAFATIKEPLEGAPGNNRLVQYYDKSRMEINNPNGNRNDPFYVTNGLLTVEMVAGRVQVGLNKWEPRASALIPVAGDASNVAYTPSYASFRGVASYENGNNTVPSRVGSIVNQSIDAGGTVGNEVPPSPQVRLAVHDAAAGHNIAAPFWEYLNRRGKVLENGQYVERPIFGDWVTVMGRPISEPYWSRMRVGDKAPWVLVQLFERRVLTYTPENAPEWQVEMGNVGLHYYVWRYGDGW